MMLVVYAIRRISIHGRRIMTPARNASSRGTALNAVSWMDVTIWSRLTTIPAASPMPSRGALSQNVAISVWRRISTTESGVMASIEALDQRSDKQVPPVDQYEQQNFERGRQHHRRQLHH